MHYLAVRQIDSLTRYLGWRSRREYDAARADRSALDGTSPDAIVDYDPRRDRFEAIRGTSTDTRVLIRAILSAGNDD